MAYMGSLIHKESDTTEQLPFHIFFIRILQGQNQGAGKAAFLSGDSRKEFSPKLFQISEIISSLDFLCDLSILKPAMMVQVLLVFQTPLAVLPSAGKNSLFLWAHGITLGLPK